MFLIGLWVAKYGVSINASVAICAAIISLCLLKHPRLLLAALLVTGFLLGVLRGSDVYEQTRLYKDYEGQKVSLRGVVIDDPAYDDSSQKEFTLQDIHIIDGEQAVAAPGTVRVRGYGLRELSRGDYVSVSGKLRGSFGNQQGYVSFAEVHILSEKVDWLESMRRSFFAGMFTAIPEPMASLGLGFLVGLRALLPESLLEQLSRTGLTHIVAVSGYNLTILVRIMRRYGMRISKFTATIGSVALILLFLAVTGLAPSIFRASIVAAFALGAWYYGRPIKPLLLLVLSGAVTAGIHPLLLWSDIGWWLSFLAFFGVLIIAPLVTVKLFGERQPRLIPQIIIETTSAQIMALPVIVAIFGELSVISIIANMLILPLIPLAMLLGFVAGIGGMLIPAFVGWIAWPATLLLSAMVQSIALMSALPWALAEVTLSWSAMLCIYAIIIATTGLAYLKLASKEVALLQSRSVID